MSLAAAFLCAVLAFLPPSADAIERRLVLSEGAPVIDVFDLAVLGRIEAAGFSLGELIADGQARSTAALRATTRRASRASSPVFPQTPS